MVKIEGCSLPGVRILTPELFEDHRGYYINLWNTDLDTKQDLLPFHKRWQEDDLSMSLKGVVRGFHGDDKTYKLIRCVYGEIFVAVVRQEDLKKEVFYLNDTKHKALLVPPRHGLAHQVLSPFALFLYKQSELYTGAENQFTLNPLDPAIGINWPIQNVILSERDKNAEFIKHD